MKGRLWTTLAIVLLAACGRKEPPPPQKPALLVQTKVVFLETDGKTERPAPEGPLRIWAPYLVGDLYGSPNEGEIVPVTLKPDLSFDMNLNGAGQKLERALVPTKFSQQWMAIEPASARVARVLPFVLPEDNIAPVGVSEWLDRADQSKLMLLYVDRPARIRGDIVYEKRQLKFDIDAKEAGYLWVKQPQGSGTFTAASRPDQLVLAVFPPD